MAQGRKVKVCSRLIFGFCLQSPNAVTAKGDVNVVGKAPTVLSSCITNVSVIRIVGMSSQLFRILSMSKLDNFEDLCEPCILGKAHKLTFHEKEPRTSVGE